jgi:hypothetical protein
VKTQGFSLPSNDGGEELFFGIFDKTFAAGDSSLAVGAAMPSDIYCGGIRKALQEKGYRLYFDSPTYDGIFPGLPRQRIWILRDPSYLL